MSGAEYGSYFISAFYEIILITAIDDGYFKSKSRLLYSSQEDYILIFVCIGVKNYALHKLFKAKTKLKRLSNNISGKMYCTLRNDDSNCIDVLSLFQPRLLLDGQEACYSQCKRIIWVMDLRSIKRNYAMMRDNAAEYGTSIMILALQLKRNEYTTGSSIWYLCTCIHSDTYPSLWRSLRLWRDKLKKKMMDDLPTLPFSLNIMAQETMSCMNDTFPFTTLFTMMKILMNNDTYRKDLSLDTCNYCRAVLVLVRTDDYYMYHLTVPTSLN